MAEFNKQPVWSKDRPKKTGVYFRTTLWARVVRQDIIEVRPGVLLTQTADKLVPVEEFDDELYWFGPIPDPPPEADWVSREQAKSCR